MLKTFYQTLVASGIFYAVVCWSGGSTERKSVEEVDKRRMSTKLTSILDNTGYFVQLLQEQTKVHGIVISIGTICEFWMELFADLRDKGHFSDSHEHQCLITFCFSNVVQKDRDECVDLWNTRRIRTCRTASCPGGVPNELYYLKHRFGSRDCGFKIESTELDEFPESNHCVYPCGDPNIQEYLDFVKEHCQLQKPVNWESAAELYIHLREITQLLPLLFQLNG